MTLPFQFKIQRFRELPSTNTYARKQAALGADEGMVYVANHQTAGRGQFDRTWESPVGKNLLFSILLRPPVSPAHAPIVTQIVCRSVARVLQNHYGISCGIKKPNDVVAKGKKICGILVESSSASPKKVEDVIIGIGLNVNQAPKGIKPAPVAMKDILARDVDPMEVLNRLLEQLKKDLSELYAHPA